MMISRAMFAGCCAVVLFWSAAATAQTADNSRQTIETVVVTAQKRSENIQKIPLTVQAFTAKSLRDLGIKASTDLSQFAPNVDIALPAGAGNQPIIAIRGVGLNDYDTNNAGPNGVYMDDVYMSAPASQTFQAFDLDRVEILKGPQGTLYGRNTSGGAINFISEKPTDDPVAEIHTEFGSFDTYRIEGAVAGPLADGLDARIAFVHNGSGGYTENALTGGRENGSNNNAGRGLVQWKPSQTLTVLWNVHGADVANRPAEYRHLGAFNPATGNLCSVSQVYSAKSECVDLFGYGTPRNFYNGAYNRQQHLDLTNWGTSLRADYDMGAITLTSLSAYESNDKLHPEDTDASPNRELEIDFGVNSRTFTQEFRAAQETDRYSWVAGLYYLHEDLRQDQPLDILLDVDKFFGPGAGNVSSDPNNPNPLTASIFYDHSRQATESYAAFGQGSYTLTDRLKLTLGARLTREHRSFGYAAAEQFQVNGINNFGPVLPILPPVGDSFDRSLSNTAFNWRTALDYTFSDETMAYASVATGFKSGGFNGGFLSNDPVQLALQLDPVKPEAVTAYETGVKSTFLDDRLLFDAALFYNDYRNLQIFLLEPIPNSVAEVSVLSNAERAHMMGADLQMEAKPLEDLSITAQLGLLQAKLDSNETLGNSVSDHGHQLPLAPHVTFSTLADYRIPMGSGHFDVQLSASYKSHQYFDVANSPYLTQRPYWLENLRIAYGFDGDRWEVAGFVHNLSGQKYYIDIFDLSSLGFYQGIVGEPRMVGAEVSAKL